MTIDNTRYGSRAKQSAIAVIIDVVARNYGLEPADFTSRSRVQPVALARQVAMYLCRNLITEPVPFQPGKTYPMSYPSIAAHFNRGHHRTAMHAYRTVYVKRTRDPEFAALVHSLQHRAMAEIKKGAT